MELKLEDIIDGTWEIKDGLVNVDGDVEMYDTKFQEIPFVFGRVTGYFYCSSNKLTTLKGAPNYVSGDFYCSSNKLTSLKGAPEIVGGDFYCDNNKLWDFKHIGKIEGDFNCDDNPVDEIYQLCPSLKFIKYLNELSVIRGNTIIGMRLEDALYCSDGDDSIVKNLKLKNYVIEWN